MKGLIAAGVFGIVTGFIGLCVLFSMWATFLWYCFDDKLATLLGNPALGTLPFLFVWPATLFIMALFKGSSFTRNSKKG